MYNDPFLQTAQGANSTTMPTIGHLIDGKLVAGGSRSQDVFNPATGKAEKRLLLADAATHGAGHCVQPGRLSGLARHAAAQARARDGQAQAAAGRTRRPAVRAADRRTRQGRRRRDGRTAARHRERRIRQLCAGAAQGRTQQERRPVHRLVERVPATGRDRRHHAVQLPDHGAAVDVADGRGLRQLPSSSSRPSATRPAR